MYLWVNLETGIRHWIMLGLQMDVVDIKFLLIFVHSGGLLGG